LVSCHRVSEGYFSQSEIQQSNTMTVRIAGSALVLSTSHPDKPMLVAESALQSVGLSPLLFEVSLVMLRWYVNDNKAPMFLERLTLHFLVDNPENLDPVTQNGPSGHDSPYISSGSRFSSPSSWQLWARVSICMHWEKPARWFLLSRSPMCAVSLLGLRLNREHFFPSLGTALQL
jgi:hypothetical protein